MKCDATQNMYPLDADQAGEVYTKLQTMADYLGNHLEEQIADGTTDGPRAAKVLIRLGQLMGKLERNQITEDEWQQIQNILEE